MVTRRKTGPKPGQFDFMCDRTWRLIASLADTSYCNASDAFLAKKLDCSTRSVRRYVKKLKDDGRLTRTTVAYMVVGGWKKRRLMKTRFEKHEFGLTRHEVMNWQRPGTMKVVKTIEAAKPKQNKYFEVMAVSTIEGFGDPYHEGYEPRNPRPCDTQLLPKTKLQEMLAKVMADRASADALPQPTDEDVKLNCRYIKASIAHHRKLRGES
jgi:hypothetical protein